MTVVAGDVPEHPLPWSTSTVNEPPVEMVIDLVVAPLLHWYPTPSLAVRVTLPPSQKLSGPLAVIDAGGGAVIVRVTAVLVALSQLLTLFFVAA
jgi:hypothetical protein